MQKNPRNTAKFVALMAVLALSACASAPRKPAPTPPTAHMEFQFGQKTEFVLDKTVDPALQQAFLGWVGQGAYTQTPVYRQLPGIFILTGKPRLAGQGFMPGQLPTPAKKAPSEAKNGHVGLVVHADGTVGPELILVYGTGVLNCCEAPQNIRIGTIRKGEGQLKSVARGDNLINISLQR